VTDDIRPRRSVLYMPAANERALEKAKTIPADAIIFDLEDAVAPDAKPLARDQACAAVRSGAYGRRELTIRCNGLDTEWGADDLAAAAAAGPAAVVIPKVGAAGQVTEVVERLDGAGAVSVMVWPMIETPSAIFDVRSIAAHPRVSVLVMGTNDLAKELRAPIVPGRHPLVPHLATALLGAREAGKAIVDGVYNDVRDAAGFLAECVQGMEMGFDGKTLIHPKQLAAANEAFAPTADEIAFSRKIIDAHAAAEAEGKGVLVVDGKLIENLHVENARRLVALAEAIRDGVE
jgi:citrate lyase subunit beta/citryl-CoA lyase